MERIHESPTDATTCTDLLVSPRTACGARCDALLRAVTGGEALFASAVTRGKNLRLAALLGSKLGWACSGHGVGQDKYDIRQA